MSATSEAEAVAASAKERKKAKYISLAANYSFCPIVIKTSGLSGPQTAEFLRDLGSHLLKATGEDRACICLHHRLAVAIQSGNAASILETIGSGQYPGCMQLFHLMILICYKFVTQLLL